MLPGTRVHILTVFSDEAERWNKKMQETGTFTVTRTHEDDSKSTVEAKPSLVTKDPAQAVPGSEIIFLPLPAFAHEGYLKEIAPHVSPGAIVVGMPSYPGFRWLVREALGNRADAVRVVGTDTLPWAARLTEYGASAEILGTKRQILMCGGDAETLEKVQACFGPLPKLTPGSGLTVDLAGPNPIGHGAIMYSTWHVWDGAPVDEVPLLYHGVDELSASIMEAMSAEVLRARDAIAKARPDLVLGDVKSIQDWLIASYPRQIQDPSTLRSCLLTNTAFSGLRHPMKKTEDGKFVPDFGYRYFTEDLPMGLVPLRGIAELVGVETPVMDKVIIWMQEKCGKEFLLGGRLVGRDVGETRAPIRFGIASMDQLIW
mmetsp:Transcript_179587/g.436962  ORF Transcript_179587/g.436962 Transcript_179587/m.436962 type:complete len:372 (-) Transcript_179587:23-1138(-)